MRLSVRAFHASPSPGTFLHWALENDRTGTAKLYAPHAQSVASMSYSSSLSTSEIPSSSSSSSSPVPLSGVQSFHAAASPIHQMVGRFQVLRRLDARRHHLCEYVALEKGEHDRLYLVSEHYERSLAAWVHKPPRQRVHRGSVDAASASGSPSGSSGGGGRLAEATLRRIAFETLCALDYLNRNQIVHGNLAARHLLLDAQDRVLVANYGMSYISDGGRLVRFPLGSPEEMSPERVATGPDAPSSISPQCDVWSLGIILMQLLSGRTLSGHPLSADSTSTSTSASASSTSSGARDADSDTERRRSQRPQGSSDTSSSSTIRHGALPAGVFAQAARMCGHHLTATDLGASPDEQALASAQSAESFLALEGVFEGLSSSFCDLIRSCLMISPAKRPAPAELLGHPYFASLREARTKRERWVPSPALKCLDLGDLPSADASADVLEQFAKQITEREEHSRLDVHEKPLSEIFHFWKLAGGDVVREYDLQFSPPLLSIPRVVRLSGYVAPPLQPNQARDHSCDAIFTYVDQVKSIPLDRLMQRLARKQFPVTFNADSTLERSLPPLHVREADVEYQRYRVALFKELLRESPLPRKKIAKEARTDIPPMLRGEIWAVILNIPSELDRLDLYESVDKESPGPADHQISLDIPRCHQYNELLSSPEGHNKFRRILKCWVAAHPEMQYWQGVDSLVAPFLVLNFNDEATAYCCMKALVDKFLRKFFGKDNERCLQEHLLVFRQLLAYHDPELAYHLHTVGFHPVLYAIPWLLTLFTHIFPLDTIYHIWDTLLLGPDVLPLVVSVAIVHEVRGKLLSLSYNNCLLFVRNMPEVNIERCLANAQQLCEHTPLSIMYRRYGDAETSVGRWWEARLDIPDLEKELAPRIMVEDLLLLLKNEPVVVLDGRSLQHFQELHFPGSINCADKVTALALLDRQPGRAVVVFSESDGKGIELANSLVAAAIPLVSVLVGGIDLLRATAESLLVSSSPE